MKNTQSIRLQGVHESLFDGLHLLVLSSFALAQPLFDILARYPVFFTANKSQPEDIVTFVLTVMFAPFLFILLIELFGSLVGRPIKGYLHFCLVALLVAVIFLPIVDRLQPLSGTIVVVSSVTIGIVVSWLYYRTSVIRSLLTFMSPAVLVFPLIFVLTPAISDQLLPSRDTENRQLSLENPTDVMIVVLDELNVTSLMNSRREIDQGLFPNLAGFAEQAHWFRNATSVADSTHYAVPAIVSGLYASKRQPTFKDYPSNLFSLLGDSHSFNVFESVTRLCPPELCLDTDGAASFKHRIFNMFGDLSVVFLHLILPLDYTKNLPVINQGWNNFINADEGLANDDAFKEAWKQRRADAFKMDRPALFRKFINAIPAGDAQQPSLNYLHILLPHAPYQYLPSGRSYGRHPIMGLQEENRDKWGDDEWAIWSSWQRAQVQLAYVDQLLGELFDKLKRAGLYDRSMLVITADHGVSFKPNEYRRRGTLGNYMDIISVPLFFKLPFQKTGVISDANVEAVDILPTIADVLGMHPLPDDIDGVSVFDEPAVARKTNKHLYGESTGKALTFSADLPERYDTLGTRLQVFGSDEGYTQLYSFGPDKNLLGKHVSQIAHGHASGLLLETDGQVLQVLYGAAAGPNFIKGVIHPQSPVLGSVRLGLAINDEIKAVTQTFDTSTRQRKRFSFLVPESAYQEDQNRIHIFEISGDTPDSLALSRLQVLTVKYELDRDRKVLHQMIGSVSDVVSIETGALKGNMGLLKVSQESVELKGWAADTTNKKLVKTVVVFIRDKFIGAVRTDESRPNVATILKNPSFLKSGYSIAIPRDEFDSASVTDLHVYAVSETGQATKLMPTARFLSDFSAAFGRHSG